jgi:hypothetical protein
MLTRAPDGKANASKQCVRWQHHARMHVERLQRAWPTWIPKTATTAEIAKIRKSQTGYQVDGITGELMVKHQDKNPK